VVTFLILVVMLPFIFIIPKTQLKLRINISLPQTKKQSETEFLRSVMDTDILFSSIYSVIKNKDREAVY
jgi:hypothetical protein